MTTQAAIKLFAPAKINLLLAVLGLREDGYHELTTIMHQVSLADIVHLELTGEPGINLHTTNPQLADDDSNLAFQAAARYLELTQSPGGVNLLIEKMIPLGAGLAGGSADAAAVLQGLNQLHAGRLSPGQLHDLAITLGSDVPFCLQGGTALAGGRGEVLTPLEVAGWPHLVMVKPPVQVATAAIYQEWDRRGNDDSPAPTTMISSLQSGDWLQVAKLLYNGLEPITVALVPQVEYVRQRLLERGAEGAMMSGSGPTVFGLFASPELAEQAYLQFRDEYKECYLVTSFHRQPTGYNDGGEA